MIERITFLGHATVLIEIAGMRILTDPLVFERLLILRRTATPEEYLHPPRLMSGAEEDVRIRELLRGAVADGSIDWPEDLIGALPTLGLANEVRAVLARARELGLEGGDLARRAMAEGGPEHWRDMVLTNVLGVAYTIRATIDALRETGD